ncbi:MAG: ATP-binding protein [Nitrosopumilus sp.]|nr:ATP-binding protein [Nitrosopumilus sp.]MDA7942666.1 ATP-binding protein [Nitrosopumilus sp.]MDA7960435.1 ATP-binding protein [Nitrosopumilus sp.]MDA7998564.1 ATP-binding protein [Nitrosopumilus sp.]
MDEKEIVGQVIGGSFGDVVIRQKSSSKLEIGTLMISEEEEAFLILQVFELKFGSQIQDRMQQMISGTDLERGIPDEFYEPEFVNYVLASIKPLARISSNDEVNVPKTLPMFFNKLRKITKKDLEFLSRGKDSIFVGHIRSGSEVVKDAEVWLPAEDVFAHHVMIPATTGRGKSNLVKTVMWNVIGTGRVGALILDAHDEYYGRHAPGLKDHPGADTGLAYYTPTDPPPGATRLAINLQAVRPEHFEGIVNFSEAQFQALRTYHWKLGEGWLTTMMLTSPDTAEDKIAASTMGAIQRKMRLVLGLGRDEKGRLVSKHEVFDSETKGFTTVDDIVRQIEEGRVVILDTSRLGDEAELIIGNIIASRLFEKYKGYKATGELGSKPVATIVIEEAPRVISKDVLASNNDSIYATIAREGRKFKVGLTAITQLTSVIPRTILANMNTKIILGNEMKQEREAIIQSAAQDLSEDDKNIASLDKGEAIITSIFVPFAMPVKIPLFEDLVGGTRKSERVKVLG